MHPPVAVEAALGQRSGRNLGHCFEHRRAGRHLRRRVLHDDGVGRDLGQRFEARADGVRIELARLGHARIGVQQPGQRRFVRVLGGAEAHPRGQARARQADVQQAQFLGAGFALVGFGGFLPGLGVAVVEARHALHAVMEARQRQTRGARTGFAGLRQEGQEHQRELQAFALVQREHLHARGVGFEPHQLFFVVGVGVGDAVAQQIGQACGIVAGAGRLQRFGQLQPVGEAALAVVQGQQTRRVQRAQVGDQGQRAVAVPALAPGQGAVLPFAVRGTVGVERGQRTGVQAQQRRGERTAQAGVVGQVQAGFEQGEQVGGFVAQVQAVAAGGHAGHAGAHQRALHLLGLAVGFHQHGDIAGAHRAQRAAFAQLRVAGAQQRADAGHAGHGGELARLLRAVLALGGLGGLGWRGRVGAVVGLVAARGIGPGKEVQCRRGGTVHHQRIVGDKAARPHFHERNAGLAERFIAGAGVQRLHRREHPRPGTEVPLQRLMATGLLRRFQVGEHVAAAEAVDGLLGVADQEQRPRPAVVRRLREHAVEDGPLQRIGVLELVHQRDAVLRAQRVGQGFALFAVQRLRQAADQVVEALQAALALEFGEAVGGLAAQAVHQADAALFIALRHLFAQLLPGVHGLRQRIADEGGPGLVRLVGLGLNMLVAGQQKPLAVVVVARGVAVAAKARPFGQRYPAQGQPVVREMAGVHPAGINGCVELSPGFVTVRGERTRNGRRRIGQPGAERALGDRIRHRRRGQQHVHAHQVAQRRRHRGRRRPQRHQRAGVVGVLAYLPPQVGGDFFAQAALVLQQLHVARHLAGLQRVVGQRAAAEAVDGVHRRQVHRFGGQAQARAERVGRFVRQRRLHQARGEHVAGLGRIGGGAFGQARGQAQAFADARAQLLRGGLGEGDREDLLHRQLPFDDQARVQRGQGEGLAGAGAGFHQLQARQRQAQAQVGVGVSHRRTPLKRLLAGRGRCGR